MLQPELSLIKSFLSYPVWEKHSADISSADMPDDLKLLYRTLNSFHETNEDKQSLHVLDLASLFFANNPKDKEFYQGVFDTLEKYEPNEKAVATLISGIKRFKILRELSIKSYEVAEGKSQYESLQKLLDSLQQPTQESDDKQEQFVTDNLQELIDDTYKQPGFRWRLECLNKSLGSLRKGDFGFVFARPETGKTTFLASEVSFFLTSFNGPDIGPVIWFNNEEQGSKVMLRVYQAYFGITLEELYSNIPKYQKLFQEQTKGRFKLLDLASIDRKTVEKVCKKLNPSLIIFDQIDKLKGFDADRKDLVLGAIYQWARELAKTYGPVIGVCQADGTGENVRYLTMGHVADAKTAKQAEADWILGIGTIHDTGWESVRFLNISKNKLMGDADSDPKKRHGHMEVLIKPEIARYQDL